MSPERRGFDVEYNPAVIYSDPAGFFLTISAGLDRIFGKRPLT